MLYLGRFYIFIHFKTILQQEGQGNGAEMWGSVSKFMLPLTQYEIITGKQLPKQELYFLAFLAFRWPCN